MSAHSESAAARERAVLNPVSNTALLTAAARAIENARPDRIFRDDLARTMAGAKGPLMTKRYDRAGLNEFIAIRTRYIDDALESHALEDDVRQIVIVAAGMDTRAYRLDWSPGTIVYELDRPELFVIKNEMLRAANVEPRCRRVTVGVDLLDDWSQALQNAGYRPERPTVWAVEGLLFFLTETAVHMLLSRAARLSASGSCLVTDMVNRRFLSNPWTQQFLQAMKADGAPWQFGVDDPASLLDACSWTAVDIKEPGQEGAHFGRWPYQVPPPSVVQAPRSFLMRAERSRP